MFIKRKATNLFKKSAKIELSKVKPSIKKEELVVEEKQVEETPVKPQRRGKRQENIENNEQ